MIKFYKYNDNHFYLEGKYFHKDLIELDFSADNLSVGIGVSGQRKTTIQPITNYCNELDVAYTTYNQLLSLLTVVSPTVEIDNKDVIGNQALNSTFGDAIVGKRIPSITAQFFYGLTLGNANPYANDAIVTQTNGATVSIVDGELILQSGTNQNSLAAIESTDNVRYKPGFEMFVLFTYVFNTPKAGSIQRVGLFDSENGFFLEVGTDTKLYFVRRKKTIDYKFLINTALVFEDGSFDITKFNIYTIRYGFLGVAPIKLAVVNPSGGFSVARVIEYPNLYDSIHTADTYLPLRAECGNTTNNTNLINKVGSVSAGIIDGSENYPLTRYQTKDLGVLNLSTGTNLIAVFRNKTTFNSIKNKIKTKLLAVSTACEGTKTVSVKIVKNPTITSLGTFTDVDSNSVMEYSTNTTINTATGKELVVFNLGKSDSIFELLKELNLSLRPTETAAIIEVSTGATELKYAMRWEEQF